MGNKVPPRGVPKNPGGRSPLAVTREGIEVRLGSGRSETLGSGRLEALLTRLHPLNQEQFIEEALHLANWDGDDFREIYDLMVRLECGAANVRADRSDWIAATLEGVEGDVVRRRLLQMRDDWRRKLEPMAHNIHQCRALAYRETFPLPQMLVRPLLMDGQIYEERTYYLPDTVVAALEFVQVLLLATNLPFGDRLRRCQLEGCRRFFLRPQGWGRQRSKYCEGCGEQAHRAAARDRMRDMRKRRKNNTKARRRK
jgi:hypothetical protein